MAAQLSFGTDGVRGVANRELTPTFVLALARAAAEVLGGGRWVVGRDTRRSGPLLQAALSAGLAAQGAEVVDLGVLPTPGIAYHAQLVDGPAAVLSASHNPFGDNGIKFFAAGGHKLDDATQDAIEARLAVLLAEPAGHRDDTALVDGAVGTITSHVDPEAAYVDHIVHDTIEGRRLDGLGVVIDAANGAASSVAPRALQALGATVTVLHASPDGVNINHRCGSTDPGDLARAVVQRRAQVGLAFDGDADRLVAVDETGAVVDGDALLGIFAIDLAARGLLTDDTIVATVMSNLGLRRTLAAHDIEVVSCPVGDRHVLAALDQGGWDLGGEQSGHLIFRRLATTGDGLLAGVQLLDILCRTSTPLSELAAVVERLPQVLLNVPVPAKGLDVDTVFADEIARAQAELGDDGRVLLRASGTEPLVRVMVEAPTTDQATSVAEHLVDAVRRHLTSGGDSPSGH